MTESPAPPLPPDAMDLYRRMALIREFEETVVDVYRRGEMPGLVHSSAGQEAAAVGVCAALADEDYLTSTHRGHGHLLAKGCDPERMMLEIMGKAAGYCGGKGGSMHIADSAHGVLGANGIVAGGVGIALGAALSASLRGSGQVAACFIGDGTMNQGLLFETMNMAALWKLPILYVCENNQYGQYSHVRAVSAGNLADRPRAFGVPTVEVDGMDVVAVRAVCDAAVARARQGDGPTFIMAATYRYSGHHVAEINVKYRTPEEMAQWRERDPLLLLAARLRSGGGVEPEEIERVHAEIRERLAVIRAAARAAPDPQPGALTAGVYAGATA